MFSNRAHLKRKTPENGIERKEFISLLVDEYYETTDIESQEQVTANLANFAYDPINFEYLRDALAIELFLELLSNVNPKLIRHGLAGLCNSCLESQIRQTILAKNGIERISSLLSHGCEDIVQKSLATLIQLDSSEVHAIIFNEKNISIAKKYIDSSFIPLKNLSNSFIQRK